MDQNKKKKHSLKLVIPVEVSGIKNFKPDLTLKVIVIDRKGKTYPKRTELDKNGKGLAIFNFPENPGVLRILLGPDNIPDEKLLGMQTINFDLPIQRLVETELTLSPIIISPFYWDWWHWWCQSFIIRGRVLCADGSPVPGAKVCAYDVDWWWWWSSRQEVGCSSTDSTGLFEITFNWCCGFWPWWWWRERNWQIEPDLAKLIMPVLQRDPRLSKLPTPSPKPTIDIFENLLSEDGMLMHQKSTDIDIANLDGLRQRLLKRIPLAAELERLRIWPWSPWYPWRDCTPDIIFKVTQNCTGVDKIIVNEGIGDVRWDISSSLNITLVANEEACCIPVCTDPKDCPEGNCMVITHACNDPVFNIGGNPGALTVPAGYTNPGVIAAYGDRPYAENVPISGVFGDMAGVDYYEFEWTQTPLNPLSWSPMPLAASGGFTRWYWEQVLPAGAGPEDWHPVSFNFVPISGHNVIESCEHYEANNAPLNWGVTRFWTSNRNLLMNWLTKNNFSDGTYYLRVKGWSLVGGNLVNERILPLCGTDNDNGIVLTIDNRPDPGPGSGHVLATTPNHRCGDGTIHTCTLEPDTDFLSVKILDVNGNLKTYVEACGNTQISSGDRLQVDFMANDPDGHLAYYTLITTYGENLAINLLTCPSSVLTNLEGGPVVGPGYGNALTQGAISPIWNGGNNLRLTVLASEAFPETCCYKLGLRAYKRTIVNCNDSFLPHSNLSEYSFGVTV